MSERVYKITSYTGERYWCLRLPAWIGRVLDRWSKFRYGFEP